MSPAIMYTETILGNIAHTQKKYQTERESSVVTVTANHNVRFL